MEPPKIDDVKKGPKKPRTLLPAEHVPVSGAIHLPPKGAKHVVPRRE